MLWVTTIIHIFSLTVRGSYLVNHRAVKDIANAILFDDTLLGTKSTLISIKQV